MKILSLRFVQKINLCPINHKVTFFATKIYSVLINFNTIIKQTRAIKLKILKRLKYFVQIIVQRSS